MPHANLPCRHEAGGNHFFQKSPVMFPVYWQGQTKRHTVHTVHAAGPGPNYSGTASTKVGACMCLRGCVSASGAACVRTCALVIMNMYVHANFWCPHPPYPVSCRCSTHVLARPSQIAAYPPILPKACRLDQETADRHAPTQTDTTADLLKVHTPVNHTALSKLRAFSIAEVVCGLT